MSADTKPVLWHIPISHYNEKVRWALAYKGIEHVRKTPQPPLHMLVALKLTKGQHRTFPVLGLNGDRIGDSTAIIAALESRFPSPSLYPEDPDERARALELEEWFDENLGPQMRLFGWHELVNDPERLKKMAEQLVKGPMARARGLVVKTTTTYVHLRYGVKDKQAAEQAGRDVLEALDRLEAELGDREYLVGDRFSVADLTAASLFYPLVLPPEGPQMLAEPPAAIERFRAPLKDRPGYRWVEEMFRRHRKPATA